GSVVRRPGLARTDVGPLQINQPQAAEKSRAALKVEFVGLRQNVPVVLGMPALRSGALLLAATAVREDPCEVVEAIPAAVSVHEASPDQLAERRVRRLRLQL